MRRRLICPSPQLLSSRSGARSDELAAHPCILPPCPAAVGLALGLLLNRMLKTPPQFRKLVTCAVAFGEEPAEVRGQSDAPRCLHEPGLCSCSALLLAPHCSAGRPLDTPLPGNVGNLPLVFVAALCHDRKAIFYRALGERCEHVGIA